MVEIIRLLNQPGYDYKLTHEGISIQVPSKITAQQLARTYEAQFLETAFKLKGTILHWLEALQAAFGNSWLDGAAQ